MPLFMVGFWGWLKKVPGEVWVILAIVGAALIGAYMVDRNAVKRTEKKHEADELRETVVLQKTAEEVITNVETRIEHAEDAVARYPYLRSRAELRDHDPELADLIDPSSAGH